GRLSLRFFPRNPLGFARSLSESKKGPDAITRTGPPSLRDARELSVKARLDEEKGETPPNEQVMPDSRAMKAERRVQPALRKIVEDQVFIYSALFPRSRNGEVAVTRQRD